MLFSDAYAYGPFCFLFFINNVQINPTVETVQEMNNINRQWIKIFVKADHKELVKLVFLRLPKFIFVCFLLLNGSAI